MSGNSRSLKFIPNELYLFSSFTFLPVVSAGSANGPSLAQIQSAYVSQTWTTNTNYLNLVNTGYQRWTVPATGIYTIDAGGGRGGDGLLYYGSNIGVYSYGARIIGTFKLNKGDIIEIVVGVNGNNAGGAHGNENGGGGGTFVNNVTTGTLLLVAGGAGGMPSPTYGTSCTRIVSGGHGQASMMSGSSSGCNASGYTATVPTLGYGGNTTGSYQGGGGGGWYGSGYAGGTHCSTAGGGGGYAAGLVGGAGNNCYDTRNNGGFGGGGGGQLGTPGGGGGYTGGSVAGAWSSASDYGGGGGSYNIGNNQTNITGGNDPTNPVYSNGMGYCKMTLTQYIL